MKTANAQAWLKKHHQVSENAFAVTFAEVEEKRWRYIKREKTWMRWVGTHWVRGSDLEMLDAIRHFLSTFVRGLRAAQALTHAESVKYQAQRTVAAVERLCRGMPTFLVEPEALDAHEFLLGTPDGTVDLRDGSTGPARPEDYITIITPVSPAPPGTPCPPRWQAFMDEVMGGDRDLQRTMQQWAGIGASGSTRDQCLVFLYGNGRNGKGVFCRTVGGLLGRHVCGAPRDLFVAQGFKRHLAELANVVTSRMVLASEIPKDAAWDTALIKELTGGDVMEIRRMRENLVTTTPRCSITIMGNHKPELASVDDAIRSRFLLVTFPVFIPPERRVADLWKQFVAAEGREILRWVIDGAVDRERSGRLFVAPVITSETDDYFAEENIIGDFINTHFDQVSDGTRVKTGEVYELWRTFCARFGKKSGPRNGFTTDMQAAGVEYKRTNDGRYFVNIRNKLTGYE
jgi:putative DNA primase/helicase